MKDYRFLQQKYIVPTYPGRGITLVSGKGMYLYDQKGEKYLDLMSNYGVNIFGYKHPQIITVLENQLNTLTNLHGSFANDVRAEASCALVKRCGESYAQVYWGNSGSEAVEAALKFTVLKTGKKKFISTKGAYHGKTLGALSAIGAEKYRKPFEPLSWDFTHVAFGNIKEMENVIDEKTAAVILEPIQGETGIIIPSDGYLKQIRKLCDENGALLILDEIQTGIGKTGAFLASQRNGMNGDIVCLAKGLGAGLPVGATIVTKEIADCIPRSIHTSTFGGNPLVCAGVLVTLDLLTDEVMKHVKQIGDYFVLLLRKIKSNRIVEIRGIGLMIGIELKDGRDSVLKLLQKEKILAIPSGENVVRFLPPYIITKKEINHAVSIFKKVLSY